MRDATLRGNPKTLDDLDGRVGLVLLVANCLVLVAAAETEDDLDGILMFDNEDLASLG